MRTKQSSTNDAGSMEDEEQEEEWKQADLIVSLVKRNDFSSLRALLAGASRDSKVNVNARTLAGETAMHVAVGRGRFNIVRYLLSNTRVRLDMEDALGRTPLIIALQNKDYSEASELVEWGADASTEALQDTLAEYGGNLSTVMNVLRQGYVAYTFRKVLHDTLSVMVSDLVKLILDYYGTH